MRVESSERRSESLQRRHAREKLIPKPLFAGRSSQTGMSSALDFSTKVPTRDGPRVRASQSMNIEPYAYADSPNGKRDVARLTEPMAGKRWSIAAARAMARCSLPAIRPAPVKRLS